MTSVSNIAPEVRLNGKTAIITGANTGIGKVTARDFFERGAKVIMACRNLEKARSAVEDIKKQCQGRKKTGELVVTELDLASFKSVRKWSQEILETQRRIDLLVNNAGVMMCPKSITEDGNELQLQTNHLGHFLLTLLLLPKIIQSRPSRIVNVSSLAHKWGAIGFDDLNYERRRYGPIEAYQQSKLANILFTKELARRIEEAGITDVTTCSLHPGVIATELMRNLDDAYFRGVRWIVKWTAMWFFKTPEQGTQTTIYCSLDEKAVKENGLYYSGCAVKKPSKRARNEDDAEKLWDVSLKMVGLGEDYDPFKNN